MAFNLSGLNGAAQGIVATQPIPDWYKGPIIKTSEGDIMGDVFAQPPPGTPQQPSPFQPAPPQVGGQPEPWRGAPPNNPTADPEMGYWGTNTGMHTQQYTPQQAEFARFFRDYWSPDRAQVLAKLRHGGGGLPNENPNAAFNKGGQFNNITDWLRSSISPAQQQSLGNFGGLGGAATKAATPFASAAGALGGFFGGKR